MFGTMLWIFILGEFFFKKRYLRRWVF